MKGTKAAGEFNCLPIVKFFTDGDDKTLGQTAAILRYFGIRFGYYNPTDWRQTALIDPIVETWADILSAQAKIIYALELSD